MAITPQTTANDAPTLEAIGLRAPRTRVVVVGLGKTGLSVAKFLAGQNIPFAWWIPASARRPWLNCANTAPTQRSSSEGSISRPWR